MNVPKTLEKVNDCGAYVDWEGAICHNDEFTCWFRLTYCRDGDSFYSTVDVRAEGDVGLEREQTTEPFDYNLAMTLIPSEDKKYGVK